MEPMTGIVKKGIGGFYFVDTGETVFRAKGRGILKRNKGLIFVGDTVEAYPPNPGDDDGVITRVMPRKNQFSRPPVSNLDKMIVVMAIADPEPNLEVIDRLLVMAEKNDIEPIVCINKIDLNNDGLLERLLEVYKSIYPTVALSCMDATDSENTNSNSKNNNSGIHQLREYIAGSRVALAGPSGVGKSSITNLLVPEARMDIGDVSPKTLRGRHTTRHVELFSVNDGYLFDTPGFTSFDLEGVEESELASLFPEIEKASHNCRFKDCFHIKEPECGVMEDLEKGIISESRYRSYLSSLDEIREQKKY